MSVHEVNLVTAWIGTWPVTMRIMVQAPDSIAAMVQAQKLINQVGLSAVAQIYTKRRIA